ncbi:substrate-binding periplasmic protein [Psychromonas ossibalaenae]|uniref:substrate-binding periplasmic protein n=1 Tax=Psychromonas ossibalaenae TaxID=444922 RepID=UPI000380FF15|nr:transporter substrate-binding domain-containing protein [Psychromonas ossibalaenae]
MSHRISILWIILLITFVVSSLAYATKTKTIRIATLDWEPYISQQLSDEGFMAEITREAFRREGYKVEYVYLPWKRAVTQTEYGEFDGYFPSYWSKQREDKSLFTDSIISGPVVLFKVKGSSITYKELSDLKPYRIGVVRGFVNTPEFDAADYLRKEQVTTDLVNIKKLLAERVDLIVADKFVGFYLLNKYLPHMFGQIESISPPLQDKKMYLCISKKSDNAAVKVEAFNKGLKEMHKDGTFDKILQKHGF